LQAHSRMSDPSSLLPPRPLHRLLCIPSSRPRILPLRLPPPPPRLLLLLLPPLLSLLVPLLLAPV
jgi:hypothetical protein